MHYFHVSSSFDAINHLSYLKYTFQSVTHLITDFLFKTSIRPMIPSTRIRSSRTAFSQGLSHFAVAGQLFINGQQTSVRNIVIKPSIMKIHLHPLHPLEEWMLATANARSPPKAFEIAFPTWSILTRHCNSYRG